MTTGGRSTTFHPSDIVLLPFPFRDRLAERARPAVVVSAPSYNGQGDVIVAAVTSHPPRTVFDYALADWKQAGLRIPSTVRMLLATISTDRVLHHIGCLSDDDWSEVQQRLLSAIEAT